MMRPRPPRAYVETYGCQMNISDGELMEGLLAAQGYEIVRAPEDADVWDPARCHGGTHVSPPERQAFAELCRWGLSDGYRQLHAERERYSWWDYRAGMFHKNYGMRIDHLLVTRPLAERVVWAEIDREAR